MADKKITLKLRASNAMASGISSAKKALSKFGKSAARIGKRMAVGFIAAGAALVAFSVKALKAYSVQIAAETALTSALKARGDEGKKLLPLLKRQASAIQEETGASDESTLATMAQLATLGVATSKLKAAAKATVALKSVGLEGASAQRAVALAFQGNYEMLNRYVPAIRNATTEQEKATAANALFAQGYEQQKALLDTLPGQWTNLKGKIGDAMEEVGEAVEKNTGMVDVLKRVAKWVKNLSDGGYIELWVSNAKDAIKSLLPLFETIGSKIKDLTVGLQKMAGGLGARIGKAMEEKADQAGDTTFKISQEQRDANIERKRAENREAERLGVKINRKPRYKVSAEVTEEQIAEIAQATPGILKEEKEDALKAIQIKKDARKAEEAITAEADAADMENLKKGEAFVKHLNGILKDRVDTKAAALKNIKDLEKQEVDAMKKAADDEVKAAQKKVDALAKIAKMRVGEFIANAKKDKDIEDGKADEREKMEKLEAKSKKRGLKLSKEDQAKLDAWRKIEAARKDGVNFKQAAADLKAAEAARKALEPTVTELKGIRGELELQHVKLNKLLALG